MKKEKELQGAIEAILFTMGESVELNKIARAIEQDEETTLELIHKLMKRYEAKDRGIRIIELDHAFQMCTKKEAYEYSCCKTTEETCFNGCIIGNYVYYSV